MKKVARFYKVSKERFIKDSAESSSILSQEDLLLCYNNLKLPKRATKGSAGYDFYAPFTIFLAPKQSVKIPTGIRAEINDGWVLNIYPRSGLGFKYRLQLDNTVGIIDSDYFFSDNEGHIIIKITNDNNENKTLEIEAGKAFAQGVFFEYGITHDDDSEGVRNGGFGSTGWL